MRRLAAAAAFLIGLLGAAGAAAEETQLAVRFAPHIPPVDVARLTSAIRAHLRDTARIVVVPESEQAPLIVDVDRTEAGFVLHFRKSDREVGASRVVAHGGEVGATEAATIVRAFVLAANVPDDAPAPPPEPSALLPSALAPNAPLPSAPPPKRHRPPRLPKSANP